MAPTRRNCVVSHHRNSDLKITGIDDSCIDLWCHLQVVGLAHRVALSGDKIPTVAPGGPSGNNTLTMKVGILASHKSMKIFLLCFLTKILHMFIFNQYGVIVIDQPIKYHLLMDT